MMVFTHKMNTTNFLAFGGPKLLAFICGKHRLVLQIIKPIFSCPNGWGKYNPQNIWAEAVNTICARLSPL